MEGVDSGGGEADPLGSRIGIAAGAAIGLIAIVVIAALSGGDSDDPVASAPADCVTAWNDDPAARGYGRHNFGSHLYEGALVTYLTPDAIEVGSGEGGRCAVIFPSQALDPEPFAAGQVLRGGGWVPISALGGVDDARLAELQVTAAGAPNVSLDRQGRLGVL